MTRRVCSCVFRVLIRSQNGLCFIFFLIHIISDAKSRSKEYELSVVLFFVFSFLLTFPSLLSAICVFFF